MINKYHNKASTFLLQRSVTNIKVFLMLMLQLPFFRVLRKCSCCRTIQRIPFLSYQANDVIVLSRVSPFYDIY